MGDMSWGGAMDTPADRLAKAKGTIRMLREAIQYALIEDDCDESYGMTALAYERLQNALEATEEKDK